MGFNHSVSILRRNWLRFAIFALITLFVYGRSEHVLASQSANEILLSCNAAVRQAEGERLREHDSVAALVCLAYLEGFLDSHAFEDARPTRPLYCLPGKEFTVGQLARIVATEFKKIPERFHEDAHFLLGLTLIRLYPCE